jgi:hypothetical protein
MKESTIQMNIISYLSVVATRHPLIYFAVPNESLMMVLKAFKISDSIAARIVNFFKKMGLLAGVPDLWLGYKGKTYFMEVKRPGENPTTKQKLIHKALNRCGFTVYVVRSVEDVESILNDILP